MKKIFESKIYLIKEIRKILQDNTVTSDSTLLPAKLIADMIWEELKSEATISTQEPEGICKHCHKPIAIRNPSGYCDHLYYPDNCEVCKKRDRKEPEQVEERPIQIEVEKYIYTQPTGDRFLITLPEELIRLVKRLGKD